MLAGENFESPYVWHNRSALLKKAQKIQTSHRPTRRLLHPPAQSLPRQPLRPRTRLPQARPQRVKGQGGTDQTSCGAFALRLNLANGKAPPVLPTSEELLFHVEDL